MPTTFNSHCNCFCVDRARTVHAFKHLGENLRPSSFRHTKHANVLTALVRIESEIIKANFGERSLGHERRGHVPLGAPCFTLSHHRREISLRLWKLETRTLWARVSIFVTASLGKLGQPNHGKLINNKVPNENFAVCSKSLLLFPLFFLTSRSRFRWPPPRKRRLVRIKRDSEPR